MKRDGVKRQSAFWKLETPGSLVLLEHRGQGVRERCGGPDRKDCGGVMEFGACPEGDAYPAISGSLGSSQRLSLSLSPGSQVLPGSCRCTGCRAWLTVSTSP